eukprot:357528-Chlamydomonas_euryale.AAC.5
MPPADAEQLQLHRHGRDKGPPLRLPQSLPPAHQSAGSRTAVQAPHHIDSSTISSPTTVARQLRVLTADDSRPRGAGGGRDAGGAGRARCGAAALP